jgi:hypothetical protein
MNKVLRRFLGLDGDDKDEYNMIDYVNSLDK